ncbi:MAG: hypothetical protein J6C52_03445 [Clostridia bacterium]|nr:hypothetical protein [Clostridia bacterium]
MIRIDTAVKAKQHNFWNNIHFHPTDAIEDAWGQRYLDAVAEAGIAHTVRMYTMFEDMVTMDEAGKLVFDFTENDTRMDYMVARGFHLLVCYNFIPPCIAEYNDKTNTEVRVSSRYKGKTLCTMPPRDFALWEEVCRVYTAHIVERYGLERVKNWYLQCYNEPDVRGFFMAPLGTGDEAFHKRMEEYGKLYAAFVRGTTAVSEALKIGGPAASNGRAFELWLKYIKEHDLRADFACAHSYGTNPQNINSGKRDIGADYNITIIRGYLDRLAKYYPDMEFVMDEFGASGAGFCNVIDCPRLLFRENEIFAAFYGQLVNRIIREKLALSKLHICLSGSHQPHQRPGEFVEFNGFRSFFTEHFIPKPIFNGYRLLAKLHEDIVMSERQGNLDLLATKKGGDYAIMLTWADESYSEALPALDETLSLPLAGRYRVTTWIVDRDHVNPYRMWQREGMPERPDEAQLARLRAEGVLRSADVREIEADGELRIGAAMSANGLMLLEIEKM